MKERIVCDFRVKIAFLLALLSRIPASSAEDVRPGHRLPEGPERPVRERAIDVEHVDADLRLDFTHEEVRGDVRIRFAALRPLQELSLDAAELKVERVESAEDGEALAFVAEPRALRVFLPGALPTGQVGALRVLYTCRARTGLFFLPKAGTRTPQAWNYGEGGLHYGFLPLYNDTNDRFSVNLTLTVPRPYAAVGNGVLDGVTENADGTRTFRWRQELPIPNYLLAIQAGEFAEVKLDAARVDGGSVPLSVWTFPGREAEARSVFGETPRMLEFFSRRFGLAYPWAKYDQVILREFGGAMETTTAVGFDEDHLRGPEDPADSHPGLSAWPRWTAQDTIAHELAHHWFGDLVTCRSLGSIWLNESFASFSHLLWNEHRNGADAAAYQRWLYLNAYLDYVRREGEVRPLEFFRFKASKPMYQEETTYLKGALVLHMLRHVVGDDTMFRTLTAYLDRNQYGSVDAADLRAAFDRAGGVDVGPFFEDWVTGGGGHPVLDVSWVFAPERRQVDLTVEQIQGELPFENSFRLPVDVEVSAAEGRTIHRIELRERVTRVALPAASRPRFVAFDPGGWLVAEVRYAPSAGDWLRQLEGGGVAAKLRAARALAQQQAQDPATLAALARVLADPKAHWGLRQEAAADLARVGGERARAALVAALGDPERSVRRAAAVALGELPADAAAERSLKRALDDPAEDVAAVASHSLGRIRAAGVRELLLRQLRRPSRWRELLALGALAGLGALEDASLAGTFEEWSAFGHPSQVRLAALRAWESAHPDDPRLAARLAELTQDRNASVREHAIERIGKRHRAADVPLLEELLKHPDPNIVMLAEEALERTRPFLVAAGVR